MGTLSDLSSEAGFFEADLSFFDFDNDGAPDLLHTRHAALTHVAEFLMKPGQASYNFV